MQRFKSNLRSHGLKAKDLKRALELTEMYRDDIIGKWNEYH
ncbi:hypothetical protein EV202_1045 [Bacteroides heparinolyticus]|uniref:Uncharacterized protein n=1 Tax=Prevotella heparinolytica TaxID=28113 RepID=A0A4R2M9D8_9BACE|nr:hypothetical protein EV202_1045 [Bacteroides heparinolyticus]